ncbi:unnamed protein product [Thelazia callipaeda]|uniref:DDE Tnp4 domain-containing protein n=1 Tax=Thelazia callipaeda TaxID=103827 RepID=A0A0N5CU25_THECL|nr:unnamed protein product [Thelazia callipaeda]
MEMLRNTRRNDERSLLGDVLNGIYPVSHDLISTDEQVVRSGDRIPTYRIAMLRVCQLQLKICSKLMEIAKPTSSDAVIARTFKPSTLKRLAGRSILCHSCHTCYDLLGFHHKPYTNSSISITDNVHNHCFYYQLKAMLKERTEMDWCEKIKVNKNFDSSKA